MMLPEVILIHLMILSVHLIIATLGSYLQILLKHITDMLPGLKSRINAQLVAVAKEHAAYGDTAESTVITLILHKYKL